MNPSIISALAALAGAVIGGLTSVLASVLAQRTQARVQWIAQDRILRQDLYKEFVEEASQCHIDALQHDKADVPKLVTLYAKIGRMRILSSAKVIATAENVAQEILEAFLQPNKTVPELMEMANSNRKSVDVLRDFSEACREEFDFLRAQQF